MCILGMMGNPCGGLASHLGGLFGDRGAGTVGRRPAAIFRGEVILMDLIEGIRRETASVAIRTGGEPRAVLMNAIDLRAVARSFRDSGVLDAGEADGLPVTLLGLRVYVSPDMAPGDFRLGCDPDPGVFA